MKQYSLVKFEVSRTKDKMYDAILSSRTKTVRVPFGDTRYENYKDETGLNAYPQLVHGDEERRQAYRRRHHVYLKPGMFSPGFFSWYYLW
jgi:hypothetical protein